MEHFIRDNNNKAEMFISTDRGDLLVSVCVGKGQYDFIITGEDLSIIQFMVEQKKKTLKINR